MLLEFVYQIRGSTGVGPFGNDWNMKLLYFFLTFALCFWDYRKNQRRDYFVVLAWATGFWAGAETLLQLTGIRQMHPVYIFSAPVPLWISLPIQGVVEGGLVTVGCLFMADLILESKNRNRAILTFGIMMVLLIASAFLQIWLDNYPGPDYGGDVVSRRNMFNPIPVVLLIVMTGFAILFLCTTTSQLRKRGIYLFWLMITFGACWTFGEWAAGTRWIEVGTPPNFAHAPPMIEFWALTWDVVVEIAFAYMPFFAIPAWLKRFKES